MLSTGPPVWNFNFIYLIIPVRWKEVTKRCLCSPSLSPASLPINFSVRIWAIVPRQLCSYTNSHLSLCWTAGVHADRTSIYDIWTRRFVHISGDHISAATTSVHYPPPHSSEGPSNTSVLFPLLYVVASRPPPPNHIYLAAVVSLFRAMILAS